MVASMSGVQTIDRGPTMVACTATVNVRDAVSNAPINTAVVTVRWSAPVAARNLPMADVGYTNGNGAYKSKTKQIPLTSTGCTIALVSVSKPGYVLVTSGLTSSRVLP
jgi:hypothetical protein